MSIQHIQRYIFLCIVASLLFACGGSETVVQETPAPPPSDTRPPATYSVPPPSTDDVQNFKLNVWDNLSTADKCGACHIQDQQSPSFARFDDINEAYAITNTLVNKNSIQDSLLITKVAGGHNCWLSSVSACTDIMQTWLSGWLNTSETATEIVLEKPPVKPVGANKNFPASPDLFAVNVHPILEQ